MKKLFLFLIPLLALTSCLDITEEIIITKEGSGVYQNTVDMSQIASMMKAMNPDTAAATEGPGVDSFAMGMLKSLKESADKYKAVPGIHNVTYSQVYGETDKYRIGFEFDNVKALNKALNDENGKDKFTWKKGQLSINNPGFNPSSAMGEDEDAEMTKMMFADAKYIVKITVPKKVKSCNNKQADIDKNTVVVSTTFGELMENNSGLNFTVKYK